MLPLSLTYFHSMFVFTDTEQHRASFRLHLPLEVVTENSVHGILVKWPTGMKFLDCGNTVRLLLKYASSSGRRGSLSANISSSLQDVHWPRIVVWDVKSDDEYWLQGSLDCESDQYAYPQLRYLRLAGNVTIPSMPSKGNIVVFLIVSTGIFFCQPTLPILL